MKELAGRRLWLNHRLWLALALASSPAVAAELGTERPSISVDPPVRVMSRAAIVDFSLRQDNNAIALNPGNYDVEVFAEPHVPASEWRHTNLRRQTQGGQLAPPKSRMLVVDARRTRQSFSIDPAEYGVAGCCADNFDELQIRYRDLAAVHPAKLSASLTYDKPVMIKQDAPAGRAASRIVAVTGDRGSVAVGRELLATGELPWSRRSLFYPIWRLSGWTSADQVSITSVERGTVTQVTPRKALGSGRTLNFEIDACATVRELNLRFRSANGTGLLLGQLERSSVSELETHTLISVDLGGVRRDLGRPANDNTLELYEVILLFAEPAHQIQSCRPLRTIRVLDDGAILEIPTSIVTVPLVVEKQEDGTKIARIAQKGWVNEANWGHMLRHISLNVELEPPQHANGIELLSVDFASPDHGAGSAGSGGQADRLCALALKALFGTPIETASLRRMCPLKLHRMTFAALPDAPAALTSTIEGVHIDATFGVLYSATKVGDGLGIETSFQSDDDTLTLTLGAFDIVPYLRSVDLTFSADEELMLAPIGTNAHMNQRGGLLHIPAGHSVSFSLQRVPTYDGRRSIHSFKLARARASGPREGEPGRGPNPAPRRMDQIVSWTFTGGAADQGDADKPPGRNRTCHSLQQGLKVCSPTRQLRLENTSSGLGLAGADRNAITIELPAPFDLPGPSAFHLAAKSQKAEIEATRIGLVLETASGKTMRLRVAPSELLPLFATDETIVGAHVIFHPISEPLDLVLRSASFVTLTAGPPREPQHLRVAQNLTIDLQPQDVRARAPGIEAMALAQMVVIRGRVSSHESMALAEWRYRPEIRASELTSFIVASHWGKADCHIGSLRIDIVSRGAAHRTIVPLCHSEETRQVSPTLPAHWQADTMIDEIVVGITSAPGAWLQSVDHHGSVSLSARIAPVLPLQDTLQIAPVLSVNNAPLVIPNSPLGRSSQFWRYGGWLSLGQVDTTNAGTFTVQPLDHPAIIIRAIRLTRRRGSSELPGSPWP